MSFIYAINFAPGFEELVGGILTKLKGEIIYSEEAFFLVKFKVLPEESELRFAKGVIKVFSFADNFRNLKFGMPDSLDFGSSRTFTLRSFEFGRPSKMESALRTGLIEEVARNTKLKYSAFEPDVDFVLAKRRTGMSYFGLKLNLLEENKLSAGELSSDISNLLLRFGESGPGSEILDAFAGYGGISKEIIKSPNILSLIAVDKDSRMINSLKNQFEFDKRVRVVASDVVAFLNKTESNFDLIIADPPWGEFQEYEGNLLNLYGDFLNKAKLKLKRGGNIVVISSRKDELEEAAVKSGLNIEAKLNILVSGKKVLVLKLGNNG
jgi:16S rRNA G966 N2-methylase RsmD